MADTVSRTIDDARRLLTRGDRAAARRQLSAAVQAHPQEARLWYWLAQALDDREHGIDALRRAVRLDPSFEPARHLLARTEGGPPTPVDPDLTWLSGERAEPAPPPAPPLPEGPALDWLEGLEEEPAEGARPPAAEAALPAEEEWSFLAELASDTSPPRPTFTPEPPAAEEEEAWSFLSELEADGEAPPPARPAPPPAPSVQPAARPTEEELWKRAEQFIGQETLPLLTMARPEGGHPPMSAVERGVFSFLDADPVAPDTGARTVEALLEGWEGDEVLPGRPATIPPATSALAPPSTSDRPSREPRRLPALRLPRALRRAVTLLLLVGLLVALGWGVLRFSLLPTQVTNVHPVVATQVAMAHLRLAPAPTPFPLPGWVGEAGAARDRNSFVQAEQLLRAGIFQEPGVHEGRVALSELLRERPGMEGEALSAADEAIARATTVEERARAAESFVWAMAVQPAPDTGQALATAEQAATEVPNSPHAHWALAMARALQGDAEGARAAADVATILSRGANPAMIAARRAAIHARVGDREQAVASYEQALQGIDYIPWRLALIEVLRQLDQPEAVQRETEYLRELAPDDPGVKALP